MSAVWGGFGKGGQHSLSHSTRIDDNLALAVVFEDITCAQMLLSRATGTSSTDTIACISASENKAIHCFHGASDCHQRTPWWHGLRTTLDKTIIQMAIHTIVEQMEKLVEACWNLAVVRIARSSSHGRPRAAQVKVFARKGHCNMLHPSLLELLIHL